MQYNPPGLHIVKQVIAQVFPHAPSILVDRMEEGMSTYVYRISHANEVFYLRVQPEANASFAPEVHVHQLLRSKGVKVPEVIHFERENELLQRSIMVTTEIKGMPLGHCAVETDTRKILFEAGRDLAIINSLLVEGFGWIRRDKCEMTRLEAEFPTYRAFISEHLESDLADLEDRVLPKSDIITIGHILARYDGWLDGGQARLAHGDFDVTHIYQVQGQYTGIIDFGEIRGTHMFYDLGHFKMYDGEMLPFLVFPYLVEGYREVTVLPPNYEQQVSLASLLIAVRTLARTLEKRPACIDDHHGLKSIQKDTQILLG